MHTKNIGIFITGGIAAYKTPLLVRQLIKDGYSVRVALTKNAQTFVTPATLAALTKQPVLTDDTQASHPEQIDHVEFAQWLDLAVVVPATANTISKISQGIADNIVTSTLLAFNGPKLIVPAMNDQMWLNPITQQNIQNLKEFGFAILPPATGFLAEGYQAVGRMPDLDVITTFIEYFKQPIDFDLQNKNILISAGGTVEPLDGVRYLSNRSSGKMGFALANAAATLGANVTLVTTKSLPVLPNIEVIPVNNALEMNQAMHEHFSTSDITIMAAAVSDFRIDHYQEQKIKKDPNQDTLTLKLIKNPDILASLGQIKTTQQLVVGFAAETNDLITNATKKLTKKKVDMIIANQVGTNLVFGQDQNTVTILTNDNDPVILPTQAKKELAYNILKEIHKNI